MSLCIITMKSECWLESRVKKYELPRWLSCGEADQAQEARRGWYSQGQFHKTDMWIRR
jgi:hypothetical protein